MFMALLLAALLAVGGIGRAFASVDPGVTVAPGTLVGAATEPTVVSSRPSNRATNVPTSTNTSDNVVTGTAVTATFSQPMDPTTVNLLTFTVKETTGNDVPGTVVMNDTSTLAIFTPTSTALNPNTSYTATVTTAAKNAAGVAMENPIEWTFTTNAVEFTGQTPVRLGTAGPFAILTKTGITDVFPSVINGDVGASPITGAAIHLKCSEIRKGTVYSVDAKGPLPCRVTAYSTRSASSGTEFAGGIAHDFNNVVR